MPFYPYILWLSQKQYFALHILFISLVYLFFVWINGVHLWLNLTQHYVFYSLPALLFYADMHNLIYGLHNPISSTYIFTFNVYTVCIFPCHIYDFQQSKKVTENPMLQY